MEQQADRRKDKVREREGEGVKCEVILGCHFAVRSIQVAEKCEYDFNTGKKNVYFLCTFYHQVYALIMSLIVRRFGKKCNLM